VTPSIWMLLHYASQY